MPLRNRISEESSSTPGDSMASPSPSPSSSELIRSPAQDERKRESSVRISRRPSENQLVMRQQSSGNKGSANQQATSSSRVTTIKARKTTPSGKRGAVVNYKSNNRNDNDDYDRNNQRQASMTDDDLNQLDGLSAFRSMRRRQRAARTATRTTNVTISAGNMTWYERLMPECLLSMTAPITGYEVQLDSDIEDDEYEILERARLRRNKRIRRRVFTFIVIAAAASAFCMYSQGRFFRKSGVRATVDGITHRLESGLTKSIKETMEDTPFHM